MIIATAWEARDGNSLAEMMDFPSLRADLHADLEAELLTQKNLFVREMARSLARGIIDEVVAEKKPLQVLALELWIVCRRQFCARMMTVRRYIDFSLV